MWGDGETSLTHLHFLYLFVFSSMTKQLFLLLLTSLICIVSDTHDSGGTAVRGVHADTLPAVVHHANHGVSITHELIRAGNNGDSHQGEQSVIATCPRPRDIVMAACIYHFLCDGIYLNIA